MQVLDVAGESMLHQGPLPLSPGASLAWLGFAEGSPLLAAQDTKGYLRLRSPQFGGAWVPVFDADGARKGSESFWVAWLGREALSCVVCPAGGQPQVHPRPVVTQLPLQVPVLDGGVQDVELESDLVRCVSVDGCIVVMRVSPQGVAVAASCQAAGGSRAACR